MCCIPVKATVDQRRSIRRPSQTERVRVSLYWPGDALGNQFLIQGSDLKGAGRIGSSAGAGSKSKRAAIRCVRRVSIPMPRWRSENLARIASTRNRDQKERAIARLRLPFNVPQRHQEELAVGGP